MQLSLILMLHLFLIPKKRIVQQVRYLSMADQCAPLKSFHVSWSGGYLLKF